MLLPNGPQSHSRRLTKSTSITTWHITCTLTQEVILHTLLSLANCTKQYQPLSLTTLSWEGAEKSVILHSTANWSRGHYATLSDQDCQSLPMWLLGSLFRRQGSSRPDGALMLAVRRLRSVSLMSNRKSAAEPSLTWDRLLLSSEYIKRKSENITRLSAEQVRGLHRLATTQAPHAIRG